MGVRNYLNGLFGNERRDIENFEKKKFPGSFAICIRAPGFAEPEMLSF